MRGTLKGSGVWALVLACGLLSGGCASTGYGKRGLVGGGYSDKEIGPGAYEISFLAQRRSFDWTKDAIVYRAAELTYENGYRYFQVTDAADKSYVIKTMGPYGGGTSNYTPVIKLKIQCYKVPPDGEVVDAYKMLDEVPVPGTKEVYSVSQRGGEQVAASAPSGGTSAALAAAAPSPQADEYYQAGLDLYQKGQYEKSLQYFEAAEQLDPKYWRAYQAQGHAYFHLDRKKEALAAYDRSLALNPDNPELKGFADKIR